MLPVVLDHDDCDVDVKKEIQEHIIPKNLVEPLGHVYNRFIRFHLLGFREGVPLVRVVLRLLLIRFHVALVPVLVDAYLVYVEDEDDLDRQVHPNKRIMDNSENDVAERLHDNV